MTRKFPIPDESKRLVAAQLGTDSGPVRLVKNTSNLFRNRQASTATHLDLRGFNRVLDVDTDANTVTVEGMTTYAALAAATLAHNRMPAVVPQLKSITIGGAVSGVGIESTSFRHGLVHETIEEMDVLLADGNVVHCTEDNQHSDLFFSLPNSYGTLGYILQLRARTLPVKPFVELHHTRFQTAQSFFEELARCHEWAADFVDGVVFGDDEFYVTTGKLLDDAPYTSDYGFEHIYYRSIRQRQNDYLSIGDYLWRWDTDWFWCSKHVGAQLPLLRRIYGRQRLNSIFYTRVMRLNNRLGVTRRFNRLRGRYPESVIQDVDIPIERAAEFLDFFLREIGIKPIWICPIGGRDTPRDYPLYPIRHDTLYVNFGFWDVINSRTNHPPGYYNRKIERCVEELGGVKSLYSDAYYEREKFWELYNQRAYDSLKEKYDPHGRFPDLYEKCVLRA